MSLALLAGNGIANAQEKDANLIEQLKKRRRRSARHAQAKAKDLVFTKAMTYAHDSRPIGAKALVMMGDKTGAYMAYHTEDESFFEPEKLKLFDAVVMLNTTGKIFRDRSTPQSQKEESPREQMLKKSLEDFVKGGKGLVGIHAGGDTYNLWKDYTAMMGTSFDSHPWVKKVPIKNLDPKSPVTAVFGGKDFEIMDEMYMFKPFAARPSERHMLLALDNSKMTEADREKGNRGPDGFYAVSWISKFGVGRNFYCSLGHFKQIYTNPTILQYYLAGIQYAIGDLPADAMPGNVKTAEK